MIDKSFLEKVVELAGVEIITVGEKKYSTRNLVPVLEPATKTLDIHTLSGLVSCLEEIDVDAALCAVHVADYNKVLLISNIYGPHRQRETYAEAAAYKLDHRFGQYMQVEDFIVYLLSMFVQDDTTADIMRIVGNITQGAEAQFADDGMTQRITAKAGVARVEMVDLPNPVMLRPFRTFSDIEQPSSAFVLRIKADKDSGPRCALFEADGGAWKNKAIENISSWLRYKLPTSTTIIA